MLKNYWLLFLALLLAGALKIWLLIQDVIPFNSDEAVVALMARHILAGERPVFFYGQAYMGSLDAWFVAAGFALFGQHVWVIRLVQILLYLLLIWTTALLGRKIFGSRRVGDVAALLLAVPAVNVTLYTTASLGCYGEGLLIGNLLLLMSIQIVSKLRDQNAPDLWQCLGWGFLAGLGFWSIALTLIFSVASGLYILWGFLRYGHTKIRKSLWVGAFASICLGSLVGAFPWLYYAWQNGFGQVFDALSGRGMVTYEQISWVLRIGQHFIYIIVFGITVLIGFRPPWEIRWLALPLMPFVLLFWIGVATFSAKLIKKKTSVDHPNQLLLISVIIIFLLIFIITPFGADPSGRYFLPLVVPLALLAAGFVIFLEQKIGKMAWGILGVVLIFQFWGTWQSASQYPPGITTQFTVESQVDHRFDPELINFLAENGETRGYTNYWVAYPLAFKTNEQIIYSPRLPYHHDLRYTERDDRYPAYDDMVAEADRVAYITTRNPLLDSHIIAAFEHRSIDWKETQIGDYHVFYQLSQLVRPEEIDLGQSEQP